MFHAQVTQINLIDLNTATEKIILKDTVIQ
jgi:hypothetical protein